MKRKVHVKDLALGMYVAELDRPWLESPFLFQGFLIESYDQIAALRECCTYVIVDEQRAAEGYVPEFRTLSPTVLPRSPAAGPGASDRTHIPGDRGRQVFQTDVRAAIKQQQSAREYITQALAEVRLGRGLDVEHARRVVKELVTSVSEAPYAALWLTNLRNKHEYTMIHCVNVCILAVAFGVYLKLPREELEAIGIGAILHDVGKMRTPVSILDKPGTLTEDEFEIIKKHPLDGYSIMRKYEQIPRESLEIIRFHHERLSGKGYPDGLVGDDISMRIRMVAICDVYDAIISDKVYREGVPPQEGLNMMYHMAPSDFGKELMQKFIKCVGIYPIGSLVELNTGAVGIVMSTNRRNRLKPVVMLLQDRNGQNYPRRPLVNLAAPAAQDGRARWSIKRVVDLRDYAIDLNSVVEQEAYGWA